MPYMKAILNFYTFRNLECVFMIVCLTDNLGTSIFMTEYIFTICSVSHMWNNLTHQMNQICLIDGNTVLIVACCFYKSKLSGNQVLYVKFSSCSHLQILKDIN